jgi:hypothetical protein
MSANSLTRVMMEVRLRPLTVQHSTEFHIGWELSALSQWNFIPWRALSFAALRHERKL